jgi:hypothetical protein
MRCHRTSELTKPGAQPAPSLRARAAGFAQQCWPPLKGGPPFLRSAAWGFGPPRISGAPACAWGCTARRGEEAMQGHLRRAATKRGAPGAAARRVASGPGVFHVGPPPHATSMGLSGRLKSASAQRATRREPLGARTPTLLARRYARGHVLFLRWTLWRRGFRHYSKATRESAAGRSPRNGRPAHGARAAGERRPSKPEPLREQGETS